VQALGAVHETPYAKALFAFPGSAGVITAHFDPFHRSASGAYTASPVRRANPTVVQVVVTQDTLFGDAPCLPLGAGIDCTVQFDPSQSSDVTRAPRPGGRYVPTPMQALAAVHDTP
jgi:hypothetical protein